VYTLGDLGIGECAGEVVSAIDFQLTACERETFEAQLALEGGQVERASRMAYEAMQHGAAALLSWRKLGYEQGPDGIVAAFRTHFHDTQLFHDPFAGGKFAQYFFRAHEERSEAGNTESAHRLIEEAQLFIEACHSCYARMSAQPAGARG
jgi:sulfite reductase (ferredoxin)